MSSPSGDYLKERLDDVKETLIEMKADIKGIKNGYVSTKQLELIIGPLVQRVEHLEARNLRVDRIVGGIILTALIGLVVTQGNILP